MPDPIERLTKELRHWSERRVREAAEALAQLDDPRALEALAAILRQPDPARRDAWVPAARALAGRGDAQAVEGLAGILADPLNQPPGEWGRKPRVMTAVQALGELRDPHAIEALSGALRDIDPAICEAAAEALVQIGDARAVGPLLRGLGEQRWGGDEALAAAAVAFGAAAAVPVVRAVRDHYGLGMGYWADKVGRHLAVPPEGDRLCLLADPRALAFFIASLGKEDPDARARVIEGWVEQGPGALETLFHLVEQSETRARLWAAEALGRIGGEEVAHRLAALFSRGDHGSCLVGAVGLAYLGDARALPVLLGGLEGRDPTIRLASAGALGGLGAAAAKALPTLRRLIDTAVHRADRDVYHDAIRHITDALRHAPTELEAAAPPEGRGTEPESAERTAANERE